MLRWARSVRRLRSWRVGTRQYCAATSSKPSADTSAPQEASTSESKTTTGSKSSADTHGSAKTGKASSPFLMKFLKMTAGGLAVYGGVKLALYSNYPFDWFLDTVGSDARVLWAQDDDEATGGEEWRPSVKWKLGTEFLSSQPNNAHRLFSHIAVYRGIIPEEVQEHIWKRDASEEFTIPDGAVPEDWSLTRVGASLKEGGVHPFLRYLAWALHQTDDQELRDHAGSFVSTLAVVHNPFLILHEDLVAGQADLDARTPSRQSHDHKHDDVGLIDEGVYVPSDVESLSLIRPLLACLRDFAYSGDEKWDGQGKLFADWFPLPVYEYYPFQRPAPGAQTTITDHVTQQRITASLPRPDPRIYPLQLHGGRRHARPFPLTISNLSVATQCCRTFLNLLNTFSCVTPGVSADNPCPGCVGCTMYADAVRVFINNNFLAIACAALFRSEALLQKWGQANMERERKLEQEHGIVEKVKEAYLNAVEKDAPNASRLRDLYHQKRDEFEKMKAEPSDYIGLMQVNELSSLCQQLINMVLHLIPDVDSMELTAKEKQAVGMALMQFGGRLAESPKPDWRALKCFDLLTQIFPEDPMFRVEYARIMKKVDARRYHAAILDQYEHIFDLDPANAEAGLGLCQHWRRRAEEARRQAASLRKTQPDSPEIAGLDEDAKHYSEAALETISRLAATHLQRHTFVRQSFLAHIRKKRARVRAGTGTDLDACEELGPVLGDDFANISQLQVELLLDMDDVDAAEEIAVRWVKKQRTNALARRTLGEVLMRKFAASRGAGSKASTQGYVSWLLSFVGLGGGSSKPSEQTTAPAGSSDADTTSSKYGVYDWADGSFVLAEEPELQRAGRHLENSLRLDPSDHRPSLRLALLSLASNKPAHWTVAAKYAGKATEYLVKRALAGQMGSGAGPSAGMAPPSAGSDGNTATTTDDLKKLQAAGVDMRLISCGSASRELFRALNLYARCLERTEEWGKAAQVYAQLAAVSFNRHHDFDRVQRLMDTAQHHSRLAGPAGSAGSDGPDSTAETKSSGGAGGDAAFSDGDIVLSAASVTVSSAVPAPARNGPPPPQQKA